MFPNPITPPIHAPHADTLLRRLLGGMSLFTRLVTIPQVLAIWFSHQAAGGFAIIIECVSCLCRYLVWFGIQKHDKNIYLPCVGWMVLDSAVILGAIIYK
jgi:hypothetical protein